MYSTSLFSISSPPLAYSLIRPCSILPLLAIMNTVKEGIMAVNMKHSDCVYGGQTGAHKPAETVNNVKEVQNLSLMRAYVESRDPSSKEVDDLMLRRFLRARNLDVEKAGLMFLKYLKWKKSFVPKGYISETEIQYDIAQNKTFFGGFDKKGRPIVVGYGNRHFQNPKPGGVDDFKRYCVYALDKLIARMLAGQEKFVAIGDVKGWGYSNSDVRGYLGALSVMQDCYPERLGKLFIVNAPRIFMTLWKMVYPWIDDNTKTKIVFVDKKQLKSRLLEEIDESQLPDIYGGKLPLTPIQNA